MMSAGKALLISAVILFVVICFCGWTFPGILMACFSCTAACVPILIVVGILWALLEMFGK